MKMPRGPRKKPAELAMQLGNPSKRRVKPLKAAAAPSPSDHHTDPPAHLLPAIADLWRTYAATPIGHSILKSGDLFALERLCTYWWEWRSLTAALQDRRTTTGLRLTETVTRKGYGDVTKARPEAAHRATLEGMIRALESQFGATPSARATVLERLAEARDPTRPNLPAPPGHADPSAVASSLPPRPISPIGTIGVRRTH